jgi:hypothetical protein
MSEQACRDLKRQLDGLLSGRRPAVADAACDVSVEDLAGELLTTSHEAAGLRCQVDRLQRTVRNFCVPSRN